MANETPLKMLESDHRKVEELFADYKNEDDIENKKDLCEKICKELEVHAELEEQFVYPLIAKSSDEGREMIEHGRQEHEQMKELISKMKMGDEVSIDDEMMEELESVVTDHVSEEESEVFPYADSKLKDELGLMLSAKMLAVKEKMKVEKMVE